MCAYSQSYHALPHWKCVLKCCAQCPSINFPDQETDNKHTNPSPSIRFPVYHLIASCTKQGRILLTDKIICREYQQDTTSVHSTQIYTGKELVMMETTMSNFHTSFIFLKFRSWHFIFLTYKYWVQITVVTPVELRLKAANNFKICYVAVIMMRG